MSNLGATKNPFPENESRCYCCDSVQEVYYRDAKGKLCRICFDAEDCSPGDLDLDRELAIKVELIRSATKVITNLAGSGPLTTSCYSAAATFLEHEYRKQEFPLKDMPPVSGDDKVEYPPKMRNMVIKPSEAQPPKGWSYEPEGTMRYHRKVIKIKASDSPNVRRMLRQQELGLEVDHKVILPGVITSQEYLTRRATWSIDRQAVGLDAEWYAGPQQMMFPEEWLKWSAIKARELEVKGAKRIGEALGVDPAEGKDSTAMSAVDGLGLMKLRSIKTPNTSVIRGEVLQMARTYGIEDRAIMFDAGGGGTQIAWDMRADDHHVRTVAFGGAPNLEPKIGLRHLRERVNVAEERKTYVTLRDQMYGELREALDPKLDEKGNPTNPNQFAIADIPEHTELLRQLSLIPLNWDKEGRFKMIPKRKIVSKSIGQSQDDEQDQSTLIGLLGCSPDEADSLAIANYCMNHPLQVIKIGVL